MSRLNEDVQRIVARGYNNPSDSTASGQCSSHHAVTAPVRGGLPPNRNPCRDDATRLKRATATWLMERNPRPDPQILPSEKLGRGLNNDATGRLICPVDYDWDDPE